MLCQYDDVECMLAMNTPNDVAEHECDYHNAVNRIEIRLKTRRHAIPASMFVIENATEGTPV